MLSLNNKKQTLTFLPFGASIITNMVMSMIAAAIVMFSAFSAMASSKEFQLVSDIAGMHCKLWLGHVEGKSAPLNAKELSILLKRAVSPQEAESFRYRFNGLPDFGFVLGKRWQVAGRADRQNFNFYFSQMLDSSYELGKNESALLTDTNRSCDFNVNLTALPTNPNAYINISPPQRRLKAILQTTLPTDNGTAHVIYEMRQSNLGWQMFEIYINGQGMKERYGHDFTQRIGSGGFRDLITHLINESS